MSLFEATKTGMPVILGMLHHIGCSAFGFESKEENIPDLETAQNFLDDYNKIILEDQFNRIIFYQNDLKKDYLDKFYKNVLDKTLNMLYLLTCIYIATNSEVIARVIKDNVSFNISEVLASCNKAIKESIEGNSN